MDQTTETMLLRQTGRSLMKVSVALAVRNLPYTVAPLLLESRKISDTLTPTCLVLRSSTY